MSKRIEFIDVLKTLLTFLQVDSLLKYKSTYIAADLGDNSIPPWKVVQDAIGSVVPNSITVSIPSQINYDYTYDGSLGVNPTAYVQLRVTAPSAGWQTFADAIVLDNGHIYAQGDWSLDTYRLVIKP